MHTSVRISKDETIAGFDAVRLRDALRRVPDIVVGTRLAAELELSEAERTAAIDVLEREGYLETSKLESGSYITTTKANALRMASTGPLFHRATAKRALDGFLERVVELRGSDRYLWKVRKACLFGSMLDESRERVGDVDLAVFLARKIDDADEFHLAEAALFDRLNGDPAWVCPEPSYAGLWSKLDARRFLQNRSKVLNIGLDDEIVDQVDHVVIYEDRS